ncbi:MAG: RNA-binding protein [Proteobacteria bacterium]|nr:RNA-binding protein [Pseudomonadota bacterium]
MSKPKRKNSPSRNGRAEKGAAGERRCIVSGVVLPKGEMLRFVAGPDGGVVLDLGERLPGRGMWLRPDRSLIETACAKGLFSRAAGTHISVASDLPDQLADRLRHRCLDAIGLARRAGQMVSGYEKVRSALKTGKMGVLLGASDGAPADKQDLQRSAATVPVVELFTAAELGAATGRDRTVHGAIEAGKLSVSFLRDADRLAGVMGKNLFGQAA